MGPEVEELEERLADYVGMRHCVTCGSGTDGLWLAITSIGLDAEGIATSPFTFSATAESICNAFYSAFYTDINPNNWTGGIDIGVEIFGCPSLPVIIGDCCQSFGARSGYKSSLSQYEIACTSFFPSKPLGCYGDGGACFTNNDEYAARIRSLRIHGSGNNKYDSVSVGINSRLDTMQAAVLLAKLEILDEELMRRNEISAEYTNRLNGVVTPQKIPPGTISAYAQYCVLAQSTEHRTRIRSNLKANGHQCPIYYKKPLYKQPAYRQDISLPIVEDVCSRVFSLPFHPYMDIEDVDKISEIIWKS